MPEFAWTEKFLETFVICNPIYILIFYIFMWQCEKEFEYKFYKISSDFIALI